MDEQKQEPKGKSLKGLLASWKAVVRGTDLPQPPDYRGADVFISQLVEHTGQVEAGACFIARVRTTSDGHPYIPQAIARGAALILAQRPAAELGLTVPADVVYLEVADTAVASAWLAAAFEDFPARQLVCIGVTGTDGKTTTCNILYEMLVRAGFQAGLLSTIRAIIGEQEEPLALHVSTPEAPVVQRYLRRMVDAGLTHCVLETTSHGLAQHRVDAIDFDTAVVTNVTHEHLDYHGGYEAYFAAKARLFEMVQSAPWQIRSKNHYKQDLEKTSVLNRDDASYEWLAPLVSGNRLTYAIQESADVSASAIAFGAGGTQFLLHLPHEEAPVEASLVGQFNVYNMLAAAAAAQSVGLAAQAIKCGLEALAGLSGRMEVIDEGQPFLTVVDFAHTPNGLEKAIGAARRMIKDEGRIITVFGSAGKRDVAKRRLMSQIALHEADLTVLTAEDPRTESLTQILETMAESARGAGGVEGTDFWRVPDRGRAIYHALTLARPQDLVLICGKGHEQSICFGTTEYPWDDREATRAALRAFLAGDPAPDLGLPTFAD